MATSTYMTFLMSNAAYSNGSVTTAETLSKLVDIIDFPDLGGEPEQLDTTTLSDKMKTSILGIQENETKTFTANYDKDTYEKLLAMAGGEYKFGVYFGGTESGGAVTPTGDLGKFTFDGQLAVYVGGKGVNEVRQMTISISPSTIIDYE